MRILKFTTSAGLIASILLSNVAYAQTSNMGFAPTVGVYQGQNPSYAAPRTNNQGYVNYYQQPVINKNLYNNLNGFKTPNRYVLPNSYQTNNSNQTNYGYGTEYYLSIGYGMGSFDGEGMINPNNESYPPVNNVAQSLGDPNSLSIGMGVMANRKFRAEISYISLSGLSYGDKAVAYNQLCGIPTPGSGLIPDISCTEELEAYGGGSIETSALMLNFYVPMTDLIDDFFGDFIVPYIGGGFGVSYNTIDDFETYQPYGDMNLPEIITDSSGNSLENPGNIQYNGVIKHFGTTTTGAAWNVELGASVELSKRTMLDVYYKLSSFGTVKTKTETFSSYEDVGITTPDETNLDTNGNPSCPDAYFYEPASGWCETELITDIEEFKDGNEEKGSISTTEIGAKLRMLF